MKKTMITTVLSIATVITSISIHANNFNMPWGNNNGSSWNMPTMNRGNGNNGNSWGNNWNMPTMNWGNGYNNGSSWNMPTMNWGNSYNNGYNNGFNNGWNMPTMNWGNNNQPWNYGNSFNNGFNNGYYNGNRAVPNAQYRAPVMPKPPQFIPPLKKQTKVQKPVTQKPAANIATKAAPPANPTTKVTMDKPQVQTKIPMPSEVKGTILAPENKPTN